MSAPGSAHQSSVGTPERITNLIAVLIVPPHVSEKLVGVVSRNPDELPQVFIRRSGPDVFRDPGRNQQATEVLAQQEGIRHEPVVLCRGHPVKLYTTGTGQSMKNPHIPGPGTHRADDEVMIREASFHAVRPEERVRPDDGDMPRQYLPKPAERLHFHRTHINDDCAVLQMRFDCFATDRREEIGTVRSTTV